MEASFGKRLRYARERSGFTQEHLAEKIGCSRALINHYENDRKQPRLKNLKLIAEILDRPQEFFLDDRIKIYSEHEIEQAAKAINSENYMDYNIVISEAVEAEVTPEELRQFINILKNAKQKARGSC